MRVTIWNEFVHERSEAAVRAVYPDGIHAVLADAVREQLGEAASVRTATLDQPEHGLSAQVLEQTDVLLWWGHAAHDRVADEIVERVQRRVWQGMGLIVLHSGHGSKVFQRLMGTGCMLRWREAGERQRLWIVDPSHPIVDGFDTPFIELPESEMYGE
ncbi:Trehalose utilization [Roseimaritima ulvae]|uniref:Trehalose utilization n=1 Tax=Roseimaritima ulvae TaxID=980254 RepID=A0A5B9QYF3_9BACT|nr:Trehalose utilization [Roseimaritima ulvae]